jgi:hypothetical protein
MSNIQEKDENYSQNQKDKEKEAKKEKRRKILEQMEFYFSDSNLSKDRFLKQEIKSNSDGCNFIKNLTFSKYFKITFPLKTNSY